MKKRDKQKRKPGPRSAGNRVTMTELDEKLAEWVGVARSEGPVVVDRYESPWVCIVAYPTWHEISRLKSYIPNENHPLVSLRDAIDSAFSYENEIMVEVSDKCESGVDPRIIIRAWVLQIVYSIGRAEIVREALTYNMLWRWFVGYTDAWQPLPKSEQFIQDMRMISSEPRIVDVVHRCLLNRVQECADACEFCINYGLLNTLRSHYVDVDSAVQTSPSDPSLDEGGDPMIRS